jgi:hypothetical protein
MLDIDSFRLFPKASPCVRRSARACRGLTDLLGSGLTRTRLVLWWFIFASCLLALLLPFQLSRCSVRPGATAQTTGSSCLAGPRRRSCCLCLFRQTSHPVQAKIVLSFAFAFSTSRFWSPCLLCQNRALHWTSRPVSLFLFCSPSPRPKATAARWTKPAPRTTAQRARRGHQNLDPELAGGAFSSPFQPFSSALSPPAGNRIHLSLFPPPLPASLFPFCSRC